MKVKNEGKRNAKKDLIIIKLSRTEFCGRIHGIEQSSKLIETNKKQKQNSSKGLQEHQLVPI